MQLTLHILSNTIMQYKNTQKKQEGIMNIAIKTCTNCCKYLDRHIIPEAFPTARAIITFEAIGITFGTFTNLSNPINGAKYGFGAATALLTIITIAHKCFLSFTKSVEEEVIREVSLKRLFESNPTI